MAPRVFISYSHDSPAHAAAVLQLANDLRSRGIDAVLDQYVSSPEEGWPRWMLNRINEADHVLMVASAQYKERFEGRTAGDAGRGVNFEGALVTQSIYGDHGRNEKFVPVILAGGTVESIPTYLQQWTVYKLPADYEDLLVRLLGQATKAPTIVEVPSRRVESLGAFAAVPGLVQLTMNAPLEEVALNLDEIQGEIEKIAGSSDIRIVGLKQGSTILVIDGDPDVLKEFRRKVESGEIQKIHGVTIQLVPEQRDQQRAVNTPPWLTNKRLWELAAVAKDLGVEQIRHVLLNSLPSGIRWRLGVNGVTPTIMEDLNNLNMMPRLKDGSNPLLLWVQAVRAYSGDFPTDQFDTVVHSFGDALY